MASAPEERPSDDPALTLAERLTARIGRVDPVVVDTVKQAARYAPTDADEAISTSRLLLGALDCPGAGPLEALRASLRATPRGSDAIEQLASLFRRDDHDVVRRLEAGLSANSVAILSRAVELGAGRATEETLVEALLTESKGLLWRRLADTGLDRDALRREYARARRVPALPRIEAVRREGLELYRAFYAAAKSDAGESVIARYPQGEDAIRERLARLPPPDNDLPLRVLCSLEHEVRTGYLEWLYGLTAGPERTGAPVSARFMEWVDRHYDFLVPLFPEVFRGGVHLLAEGWTAPGSRVPPGEGRFAWDEVLAAGEALSQATKDVTGGVPAGWWLLYVLVRDGARDLWPLLALFDTGALDHATAALVRATASREAGQAVSATPTTGRLELQPFDLDALRARERELAPDLPISAWTIFAVLIERHGDTAGVVFGYRFTPADVQRIVDEARKLVGGTSGDAARRDAAIAARPEARATRDYWTADDKLGYRPFADAIASFIRHPKTRPPLTIGIKAPWGAGKSSLMRMVQQELDPRADVSSWRPRAIAFDASQRPKLVELDAAPASWVPEPVAARVSKWPWVSRIVHWWRRSGLVTTETPRDVGGAAPSEVTVKDLLERTARPPATETMIEQRLKSLQPKVGDTVREASEWRPTVWFNPWMYQTGEQTWAGLANEIISQLTERLAPAEREWFWLQLNLQRIDREAVRSRVYRAFFQRLVPAAIASLTVLLISAMGVAGSAIVGLATLKSLFALALPLGPAGFLVVGAVKLAGYLGGRAATSFPDLLDAPKVGERMGDAVRAGAESLSEVIEDPAYGSKTGFLYLVQTDMKRVLDLIATPEQPLVVFVDDLDRCAPGTVAQVIEAINLFLAGEFPNCIFILAMEPEIVAAHVEVANEKLVARLGTGPLAAEWTTLGWRFLDKIVQLPMSLPEPDAANALEPFLDDVLGAPVANAQAANPTGGGSTDRDETKPDEARIERIVETVSARGAASIAAIRDGTRAADQEPGGSAPAAGSSLSREATIASRRLVERLLSERNRAVRAAIEAGIDLLGPRNPRQVKRFVNLFRFYALIEAMRTVNATNGAAAVELEDIAKVAALAIRWPSLVNTLTRRVDGKDTLEALETASPGDRKWIAAVTKAGLVGPQTPVERYDDLRELLRTQPHIATLAARLL